MRRFYGRKGIELTFNAIIIAVLCLMVLVVTLLIYTGMMEKIIQDLTSFMSCEGRGGTCSAAPCGEGYRAAFSARGCQEGQTYCCSQDG